MSTFEKDKINQQATFRRVQSFIHRYERKCSKKLGWISSNLLGFFWGDSSVQTFRSFSISLVTFSSVFFLFIYKKKAHVDKEINNRSVKSVGMEMNNLC